MGFDIKSGRDGFPGRSGRAPRSPVPWRYACSSRWSGPKTCTSSLASRSCAPVAWSPSKALTATASTGSRQVGSKHRCARGPRPLGPVGATPHLRRDLAVERRRDLIRGHHPVAIGHRLPQGRAATARRARALVLDSESSPRPVPRRLRARTAGNLRAPLRGRARRTAEDSDHPERQARVNATPIRRS